MAQSLRHTKTRYYKGSEVMIYSNTNNFLSGILNYLFDDTSAMSKSKEFILVRQCVGKIKEGDLLRNSVYGKNTHLAKS